MVSVKYVLETHSSCKLFKISQQMSFDFIFISHGCRDKLKPFQQYTYLAVGQSERFLRNFSFVSLSLLYLFCLVFFFFTLCTCHFLTVLRLILYLWFLWLFVQRSHCCSFQHFYCCLESVYMASTLYRKVAILGCLSYLHHY